MIRAFFCPACDGAGAFVDSPSGCANDPSAVEWECTRCDGEGTLQLDPASDDADGLRPYTPSKRPAWSHGTGWMLARYVDPLVELARARKVGKGRSASYYAARRAAMRPLTHPLDGYGPDLISPETAAYFNALVRKAA